MAPSALVTYQWVLDPTRMIFKRHATSINSSNNAHIPAELLSTRTSEYTVQSTRHTSTQVHVTARTYTGSVLWLDVAVVKLALNVFSCTVST